MRATTAAISLFMVSFALQAQDTRGNISGTVTDSTAAVIAGAMVTVKNTGASQALVLRPDCGPMRSRPQIGFLAPALIKRRKRRGGLTGRPR